MNYSVEQAKSVFDLLRAVSPYAMPLIISLIFPIIWVLFKKLLGVSIEVSPQVEQQSSIFFQKIIKRIKSLFSSLNGGAGDKIVFYLCILLFFSGIAFLKIGEKSEEEIRQKALELKKFMEIRSSLSETYQALNVNGFDRDLVGKIRYNYPNDFVAYMVDQDTLLAIVDTMSVEKVKRYVFSFLDSYLRAQFETRCQVDIESLTITEHGEDIKRYFRGWLVWIYLSEKLDKEKYVLDYIDGRSVIRKYGALSECSD